MNSNHVRTDGWSNSETQAMYEKQWPLSPDMKRQHASGHQCGGCSFFAKFNSDWGLCCHSESKQFLETIFEHFTCPDYVREGWGPHSFTVETEFHCRCGGEPVED